MKCDIEGLEMAEQPAAKFEEHSLADATGGSQEHQPAYSLNDREYTECRHDHHEFTCWATGQQWRDRVIDTSLNQQRNR